MIGERLAGAIALAVLGVGALVGCSDDGGGGASGDEDISAFCERAGSVESLRADFSTFDPTDPDQAVETLREGAATFGRLAGVAPDELRDDVDTMVDVLDRLADAIEELEEPDAAAVFAVIEEFDDDLVAAEEAADQVAVFAREECGLDLDTGEPVDDGGGEDTTTTTEPDEETTTTTAAEQETTTTASG